MKNERELLDDVDEILNELSAGQKLIKNVFADAATLATLGVSEYLPALPWQSKITQADLLMAYLDFNDIWDILIGAQIELDEQVQVLENDLQTVRACIVEQGLLGVASYRTPGRSSGQGGCYLSIPCSHQGYRPRGTRDAGVAPS